MQTSFKPGPRRILAAFAAPLLLALSGCWSGESLQDRVARYAELPGAKATDTRPLLDEVNRIEAAGETPLALMRALDQPPLDPEQNAAALLSASLNDATRLDLFPRLEKLIPQNKGERFDLTDEQLVFAAKLLKGVELLTNKIALAEAAPECRFETRFDLGFFGKMRYVDDVAIACRLHLLACAPLLKEGRVSPALDHIDAAMLWVDRLAAVPRVETRLRGANLRRECLRVVEAVATAQGVQQADTERLYAIIRRSLDAWPADRGVLVGDRALALHAYETIREGRADLIVTNEERERLSEELAERIDNLSGPEIDRDELGYLMAMRTLIEAAEGPHFESVAAIDRTLSRVAPDGAEGEAAPLAANLFLPGVGYVMLELARDRSLVEAWAIALAAAGELDMPPFKRSPATGEDYKVERIEGTLVVYPGDSDLPEPTASIPE